MVAFPLSPFPSYLDRVESWSKRSGVFHAGDAVTGTMLYGNPTAYRVLDYWGAEVSAGSISGTALTVAPPSGGFRPGWYRVLFTGTQTDALFGDSYGASSFIVVPPDPRFPTNPPPTTTAPATNAGGDLIAKGVLGIGTSRISIANAATPGAELTAALANAAVGRDYWTNPATGQADAGRTSREMFVQWPSGTADNLTLAGSGGGTWLRVYVLSGQINGANLTVEVSAGTTSGDRILVRDSGDLVEDWDNLPSGKAAQDIINAGSDYIRVFGGGTGRGSVAAATAIGSARRDGVTAAVVQLYAAGITRFEGPSNEPPMNAETAHQMRLFADAVHAGHPSAVAIGPNPVNALSIEPFLAAGGAQWCDELSIHDYNCVANCDLNIARFYIESFWAIMAKYGLEDMAVWQTEAGGGLICCYGVYHPRRARNHILHDLLWEQYGIPRERNPVWYDTSHGFWAYPCWIWNRYGSPNPHAILWRTMAAECHSRAFTAALDFGDVGNRCYLGSVYDGPSGRTVVTMAASFMPDATVTLSVPGLTAQVTLVDAFGNESTVQPTGGRLVVPLPEIPQYLRLPAGQPVAVYRCNDWPQIASDAQPSRAETVGEWVGASGKTLRTLGTGKWMQTWGSSQHIYTGGECPGQVVAQWQTAARFDRIIIWTGPTLNTYSTLIDFDVDISNDGVAWTTVATVTKDEPVTYLHGTNYWNTGCRWETFWDEQTIFDVPLSAPVTAKFLRLNVRAASYGAELDPRVVADGAGLHDSTQQITIQEIMVLCDRNALPHLVRQ